MNEYISYKEIMNPTDIDNIKKFIYDRHHHKESILEKLEKENVVISTSEDEC